MNDNEKPIAEVLEEIFNSPVLALFQEIRSKVIPEEEWTDADYIHAIVKCLNVDRSIMYQWLDKHLNEFKHILPKDKYKLCLFIKENVKTELLNINYLSVQPDTILAEAFKPLIEKAKNDNTQK